MSPMPKSPRARLANAFRSTRVPSRVLVAVLCAVLAGIWLALFQAIGAERAARGQVSLTTEVLRQLRTSLRAGLNAETGQRGFLLTGDPLYLDAYDRGARLWLGTIDELDETLAPVATEAQAAAIERMRALATAKLDELARTIDLTREGRRDEALALVRTDEGKRLMDAFRDEVASLEDEEQLILSGALVRAEIVEARALPILAILALSVVGLLMLGLWLERRAALAESAVREADDLRRAHERSDLLARELNHRVKNLFAVILSIVTLSGRGATDAGEVVRKIRARIHALSLAHAVSQGQLEQKLVDLADVLSATLEPYLDPSRDGGRVRIEGPTVALPVRSVTPIGLIAHELATNAAKYGALSVPAGRVHVEWEVTDPRDGEHMVRLVWSEHGGPEASEPVHAGFGSIMLRQAASQLRGTVERRWHPTGLVAEISFSLPAVVDVADDVPARNDAADGIGGTPHPRSAPSAATQGATTPGAVRPGDPL